jgi:hypothetical protein
MMQHLLATWQNIGIGVGLIFMALVVMQKGFERCATPPDTGPRDYRLHMDRERELPTIGKDVTPREYDPVAREQLKRLQDRRRKAVPDNGQRRRKTDQ